MFYSVSLDKIRYPIADEIVVVDEHHVTRPQAPRMLDGHEEPASLIGPDVSIREPDLKSRPRIDPETGYSGRRHGLEIDQQVLHAGMIEADGWPFVADDDHVEVGVQLSAYGAQRILE